MGQQALPKRAVERCGRASTQKSLPGDPRSAAESNETEDDVLSGDVNRCTRVSVGVCGVYECVCVRVCGVSDVL